MNWKIYDITEIESKWDEWDRLNKCYYDNHPYYDSRFIRPLVKYFGTKAIKLAELKNDSHKITGMLLVEKKAYGMWRLFVPSQMQIVPILLDPKNCAMELQYLLKFLPGFCWRLECLNQDICFSPFSEKQDQYIIKYYHCTTTSIGLDSSFSEFWEARKKKVQQNVKRYFNRVNKNDINFFFRKIYKPEELSQGLIRYGLLESLGWKGKKGTAIHPDNLQGLFYNDVFQSFGANNQAIIYALYFNDELVASRLCLNNKKMIIMLKVTFNENFKKFAPGRLLTYKVIEDLFEGKLYKRIEFYTNATKDQIDWSSSTRDIYHFEVYRNRILNKIIKFKNRK